MDSILKKTLSGLLFALSFSACQVYTAKSFDFPDPVDTTDKPITFQEKKVYNFDGVYADNLFDGARLNGFELSDLNYYKAIISPENFPINTSPWYAFRIWSDQPRDIILELNYTKHKHRYRPKISRNGIDWELLDTNLVKLTADSIHALFPLSLTKDTLWIAGQELSNSGHIKDWSLNQAEHQNVKFDVFGKSKLGRDLFYLDILEGESKKKDIIVILSRQHPPEVTGYKAMEAFVEEVLANNHLSKAFRKQYRILVFPLMNPDGVDLGHWRHNAGGIDLNRDWAYYHQPESRQMADFVVKISRQNKSQVVLGLDFHSTLYDVYYTFSDDMKSVIPNFKDYWIAGIKSALPDYEPYDSPSPLGAPITKGWFYKQFNAESITFEIGDQTQRDFIKQKGKVAAQEMMQLLIFKN